MFQNVELDPSPKMLRVETSSGAEAGVSRAFCFLRVTGVFGLRYRSFAYAYRKQRICEFAAKDSSSAVRSGVAATLSFLRTNQWPSDWMVRALRLPATR